MLRFIKAFFLLMLFIPLSSGSEKQYTELRFHESWSDEEHAALTEFHRYLMQDFYNDMWKRYLEILKEFERLAPKHYMATDYQIHLSANEFRSRIHQETDSVLRQLAASATSGTVKEPTDSTIRASLLAAQTGYLSAVRALVAHGADVNGLRESVIYSTPFTEVLSGVCINGRKLPWEERKATVEFLLRQGAELNPEGEAVLIALQLSLLVGHETEPWHWALDHGRQVTPACLDSMMTSPGGYSLAERVIREKRVDVNDDGGYRTPLQALIYAVTCCDYADELQELEAESKLALLLTAGARVEDLNIATLRRRLNEPDLPAEVAEILTRMLNKLQHSNYHD